MLPKLLLLSTIILGLSPLAASVADAADIQYVDAPAPHFTVPADTPLAVFQRLEDIWIVTTEDSLNLPSLPESLAVIETENLYVPDGAGVRVSLSVLKGLRVERDSENWRIYINQLGAPQTLALPLDISGDIVTLNSGAYSPRRATSFDTRETYTAVPSLAARGFSSPENIGILRRLETAAGAAFVSSNGAPLGMTTEDGKTTFRTLNNAISAAVARREGPINLSVVDSLLQAARDADGNIIRTVPAGQTAYHGGMNIPSIDPENESTVDDAVTQMNRALDQVGRLSYPLPTDPREQEQVPDLPSIQTPELDDAIIAALAARDEATVPMTKQEVEQALPENRILPDFGDRTRRELDALERRLGQRWYFTEKNTDKISAANRFAGLKIFMQQYPEALGILQTVIHNNENTDPALVEDTKLLEAISLALMERYPEAQEKMEKITTPSVDKAIWSGYIQEGLGEHKKAADMLEDSIEKSASYPPLITQKVRYAYAKALFEEGRMNEALNQIDRLALLGGRGRVLPKAQLLMGRIYKEQGQKDLAEQVFITLASNSDMEVSSHALYHFLDLLVERGDLTPEAAAIRFENLRFLWRGDEVEENTLFKLANLYIQSKQYKNALERLKYLTVNFPESEYVPQAAAMMTKIFGDLFMDRRTDAELDPIGMLGLYYDFRELTPANEEGDRVVMNVANRLATLGLYDRAVETLERQLKFRANNPAAVGLLGLELAKLHFQNYSVGEGLEALNRTASKDLAPSLQNDRKIMRAKLLGLAMKYEGALEVAKEATGTEAQDLQAEFAWELGEFKAVVDAMKPMFDAAGGSEWTGTDVTRFLRLATAQAALGQADDLQDLAIRYEQGIALHELTEQVDFLIQSARSESPAESRVEDELRTNPNEVPAGSSVWLRGEKGLEEQNDFNRDYRRTRQRWRLENEEADRSEMRGLQQEIQNRQNRFR